MIGVGKYGHRLLHEVACLLEGSGPGSAGCQFIDDAAAGFGEPSSRIAGQSGLLAFVGHTRSTSTGA